MSADAASAGCRLHRLASGRIGQVALCPDCAALHLSVQCMTLRMDPAAFLELVELMVQARERLLAAGRDGDEMSETSETSEAPGAPAAQGVLH